MWCSCCGSLRTASARRTSNGMIGGLSQSCRAFLPRIGPCRASLPSARIHTHMHTHAPRTRRYIELMYVSTARQYASRWDVTVGMAAYGYRDDDYWLAVWSIVAIGFGLRVLACALLLVVGSAWTWPRTSGRRSCQGWGCGFCISCCRPRERLALRRRK